MSKNTVKTAKVFNISHHPTYWLGAFWIMVFILNMGPQFGNYGSFREIVETVGNVVVAQAIVAIIVLKVLVPQLLDKSRVFGFITALTALLLLASQQVIAVRYLYIEPTYPDTYANLLYVQTDQGIAYRLFSFWAFKYIIFSKMPLMFFPTAVLMARQFYKKQSDIIELREQKNQAELRALKNQLNPHFLFNTLNNLYLLALKKSEQTPVVIEKLADILDYLVYRCNERYVSINSEVTLIQNYLDLESLRQSDRLAVNFVQQIEFPQEIAPLLLLNLVENACKHSTNHELNCAYVDIALSTTQNTIECVISNSKPATSSYTENNDPCIGLDNMHKQLEMLYPNRFTIEVVEDDTQYQVKLVITAREAL